MSGIRNDLFFGTPNPNMCSCSSQWLGYSILLWTESAVWPQKPSCWVSRKKEK